MNKPEKPSCIKVYETQMREVGRAVYEWTFHNQAFPHSFFDLCWWYASTEKKAVSMWLSCHASERLAGEFDAHDSELSKSIVRLGRLENRLKRIDAELAKSDRAVELLDGVRGLFELELAMMHSFLSSLNKAFAWNEIRGDSDAGGSACTDGLHADNRMLVWGGVSFPLTTNQSIVFRLLIDAYQGGGGDVFKNDIEDELGGGALRDSFRRNHNGAKVYDPSWELIIPGNRKDSKRMIDPSVVRADPKKFSDPQRNPQRSPE